MRSSELINQIDSEENFKANFKLLRVISSLNPMNGGPVEAIKQMYLPMKKLGIELEVVCSDPPDSPWLLNINLPIVHALGPSYGSYAYNNKLLPWLKKNVDRFDAIMVHGIWQYHSLAVRLSLVNREIPYYLFTHGMLDPWFKRKYPIKHFKKWIYWVLVENKVLKDACSVIFTSDDECLLARQSFWPYKTKEVVSPYGTASPPVDDKIRLKESFFLQYPNLSDKKIILFLSRIHEKKGCDLLITAFSNIQNKYPEYHLVFAGPDENQLIPKLKNQADQLGISNKITWLGMVQGDIKWGLLYAAEVFCLPSHQENFGIVISEALACGKPVLISNKINIWKKIKNDNAGYIAEDDEQGTLKNLISWLNLEEADKLTMSNNASRCFYNNFHIDNTALFLSQLLRKTF